MKIKCISLHRRHDRRLIFSGLNFPDIIPQFFEAIDGELVSLATVNEYRLSFDQNWRDPIHGRRMTKGEVGCLLSHLSLWDECGLGDETYLILEDDFVVGESINLGRVEEAAIKYGCVYLSYLEMDKTFEANRPEEDLVYVSHPYWCVGYAITPDVARTLSTQARSRAVMPSDQLLAVVNSTMKEMGKGWVAFSPALGKPRDKRESGSNIDPHHDTDYFVYGTPHFFSVATDKSKAFRLIRSCEEQSIAIQLLGEGRDWLNGDTESHGGGYKISLLSDAIKDLPGNDIVFFTDGYDSFFLRGQKCKEELLGRYLSFGSDIVFSGQKDCWPDPNLAHQYSTKGAYPYLNSGGFIGSVNGIRKMISSMGGFIGADDDQLLYTKEYLSGNHDIKIDVEGYIFQTSDDDISVGNGRIYNADCSPIVFHGNGGEHEKLQMQKYYQEVYPENFVHNSEYKAVARDILATKFLTRVDCHNLISLAERRGGWVSLDHGKFFTRGIRLREVSEKYYDLVCEKIDGRITEIAEEYWHPLMMYGVRDIFITKYVMGSQTSLELCEDASLVTGVVKLNNDYQGAELSFPRQAFTTKDVPVGDIILFPGQVTHGHRCEELKSGIKYSLAIWTKRWKSDTI